MTERRRTLDRRGLWTPNQLIQTLSRELDETVAENERLRRLTASLREAARHLLITFHSHANGKICDKCRIAARILAAEEN